MSRTRSISSIDNEIKKVEDELIKVQQKQEALVLTFHVSYTKTVLQS